MNAQTINDQRESKQFNFFLSFGAGVSILRNVPTGIYQDNHSNLQLGTMIEKPISKKSSIISGLEFERLNYQFDGYLIHTNDKIQIVVAQSGIKYTKVIQNVINIPIQGRFYLKNNLENNQRNAFLQTGLRFGVAINSNFSYRQNNQQFRDILNKYQNRIVYQWELMIGFNSIFFKKLDLLNDSTFGFMYQIKPIFEKAKIDSELNPVHFTWRFLF